MVYSLSQQLIRTDLTYWMLYAILRPNRNCRLLIHTYYTQYASDGDDTQFLHIDMNIPEHLKTRRGGNFIQASARYQGLRVSHMELPAKSRK